MEDDDDDELMANFDESEFEKQNMEVILRIKPAMPSLSFNNEQVSKNSSSSIIVSSGPRCVRICNPTILLGNNIGEHNNKVVEYYFDWVLPPNSSQEDTWKRTCPKLMKKFFSGGNVLLFCYGPSGGGKTYTIQGSYENPGLLPQILQSVFDSIENARNGGDTGCQAPRVKRNNRSFKMFKNPDLFPIDPDMECKVWISYLEIYKERIYDLLRVKGKAESLELRMDKMKRSYVMGLEEPLVDNFDQARVYFERGIRNRQIAETNLNRDSSRSHSVFTIKMIQSPVGATREQLEGDQGLMRFSKFSIIDLAGNERSNRSMVDGMTRIREAGSINQSLFTLGRCIDALRFNQSVEARGRKDQKYSLRVVPFRDSVLTKLFREFFVGEGKAVLLINISSDSNNYEESVNALNFGTIAKDVVTTCRKKVAVSRLKSTKIEPVPFSLESAGIEPIPFSLDSKGDQPPDTANGDVETVVAAEIEIMPEQIFNKRCDRTFETLDLAVSKALAESEEEKVPSSSSSSSSRLSAAGVMKVPSSSSSSLSRPSAAGVMDLAPDWILIEMRVRNEVASQFLKIIGEMENALTDQMNDKIAFICTKYDEIVSELETMNARLSKENSKTLELLEKIDAAYATALKDQLVEKEKELHAYLSSESEKYSKLQDLMQQAEDEYREKLDMLTIEMQHLKKQFENNELRLIEENCKYKRKISDYEKLILRIYSYIDGNKGGDNSGTKVELHLKKLLEENGNSRTGIGADGECKVYDDEEAMMVTADSGEEGNESQSHIDETSSTVVVDGINCGNVSNVSFLLTTSPSSSFSLSPSSSTTLECKRTRKRGLWNLLSWVSKSGKSASYLEANKVDDESIPALSCVKEKKLRNQKDGTNTSSLSKNGILSSPLPVGSDSNVKVGDFDGQNAKDKEWITSNGTSHEKTGIFPPPKGRKLKKIENMSFVSNIADNDHDQENDILSCKNSTLGSENEKNSTRVNNNATKLINNNLRTPIVNRLRPRRILNKK